MPRLIISNSRIWNEDGFLDGHALLIEAGLISALARPADISPQPGDITLDASGRQAIPGFIDLHIHGSAGHDVMDARADAYEELGDFLLRQGVTSCLATTMTDSRQRIWDALGAASNFIDFDGGAPFIGIHLEGPYLNPAFRGSQPAQHLLNPVPKQYRDWLEFDHIKLMTMAPELPGGAKLLREATERGIHVAIGHSAADYDAARGFFRAGVSQVTHTFNGMAGLHHRAPGILAAAVENPAVTFQLIADGVHVHPAVVRLLLRLVGRERIVAITDAMQATGLGDGDYGLGDVRVTVRDGVARAADGGLAGSTLTMPAALQNMMRFCDLTLAQALPMFTRVPARSIGIYPQKGSLKVGADADVALWDDERGVMATVSGGHVVYEAK